MHAQGDPSFEESFPYWLRSNLLSSNIWESRSLKAWFCLLSSMVGVLPIVHYGAKYRPGDLYFFSTLVCSISEL